MFRLTLAIAAIGAVCGAQAALLYSNGSLVNGTGNGFGGANTSVIQTGGTLFGFGSQSASNNHMADNFTVQSGFNWTIESLTFFTYQTGSTTTSTITAARAAIFSSTPTDLSTNLLTGSLISDSTILSNAFTGTYRVTSTTLTNNQRPIMAVTVDVADINVAGGTTLWGAWSAAGSLASGPWSPPIQTVSGGTGIQAIAGVWGNALDGSTQMELAFEINGTATPVPEPASMIILGGALAAFARRRKA